MKRFHIYRIESARMPLWDYSSAGLYFLTICSFEQTIIFGEIVDDKIELNEWGRIVVDEWQKSFMLRSGILMGEFVVMPNHFHGIIQITRDNGINFNNGIDHNDGIDFKDRRDVARNVSTTSRPLENRPPTRPPTRPPGTNNSGTNKFSKISPKPGSISTIIRSFKSATTKRMHENGFKGPVWQTRFYDHIIRNQKELDRIRQYIIENPKKWEMDKFMLEPR